MKRILKTDKAVVDLDEVRKLYKKDYFADAGEWGRRERFWSVDAVWKDGTNSVIAKGLTEEEANKILEDAQIQWLWT